jgi:hypothetical protein
MAPILRLLTSSASKGMDPRYACLSEAKVSHSHKVCAEVSSCVSHLHEWLLINAIKSIYSQGVMFGKKARNNSALCPAKGQ